MIGGVHKDSSLYKDKYSRKIKCTFSSPVAAGTIAGPGPGAGSAADAGPGAGGAVAVAHRHCVGW